MRKSVHAKRLAMTNKDKIKQDLDKILTEVAKTQNIQNYEIHLNLDADFADGFVAQFFTGEVQNTDTGEKIGVAIKKGPYEIDFNTFFKNEDLFYSTVFPALRLLQNEAHVSKPVDNVPKYFCGSSEPKNQFIAMENLKSLGYVLFDKKQYFDKEHLEYIFKLYGKFHAASYVLRNKDLKKYQEILKEFVDAFPSLVTMTTGRLSSVLSTIVNVLRKEEDKKSVYDTVQLLAQNCNEAYLKSTQYHGDVKCITHGDCWSNNMLFNYSETGKLVNLKLLDFQFCRESTPVHDLSYFFYSGASKEDLDNLESHLRTYYNSFSNFVKKLGGDPNEIFSFEVLLNEWKQNALMGVLIGIGIWQLKLVPKEEFQEVLMENNKDLLAEDRGKSWQSLFRKVNESAEYQERIINILVHACNYGILSKDKLVRK